MKTMLLATLLVATLPLWANNMSPVGKWTTYNEDNDPPTPESIVEVYYDKKSGTYNGKIEKSLTPPVPGESKTCQNCKGRFENKPIKGLEFLWGFVQTQDDPNVYDNGHVLDPRNGNEYNAKMTVKDDGNTLEFRGYMGISMFGSNRTWTRVEQQHPVNHKRK